MTKEEALVIEGLKQLARDVSPVTVQIGKVTDTNLADYTCTVQLNSGTVIPDARLRSVVNGKKKCVLIPKRDSYVALCRIERTDDYIIIATDEVEKIIWETESVTVDAGSFVFNGGDNGGVPVAGKIDKNLNKLKDYLAQLNTAIATAITASGAPNASAAVAAFNGNMIAQQSAIIFTDMENLKLKH